MQAIILCGGRGTRLQEALPRGLPKAMADICGKPFLWYLLTYWEPYVDHFILATGFGHSKIQKYFGNRFGRAKLIYSQSMQGTDYAVLEALKEVTSFEVFVLNGDTYLEINPGRLTAFHRDRQSNFTLTYSTRGNMNAGIDLRIPTAMAAQRPNIYPCDEYFMDIGTPETLDQFRRDVYESKISLA